MPFFGDSAATAPEITYDTLFAGDHGASATAAATAHQVLADTLASSMATMEGNAASTAAGGWQGAGGVAMLANATESAGVMALAVAWLQESSMLAMQIVEAYTLALESMIPSEVCTANRATWDGLLHTNFIGQNFPPMAALDLEYFGHFWVQNATLSATYQGVVTEVLAMLATPPPFNPAVVDPAGPMAGVVQAGADAAAGSLQAGFKGVTETASTSTQAARAPASAATDGMSQMMSVPIQMASQFGQMAGQLPQMFGQIPQMLSQAIQMPMGMLGQLGNAGQVATGAPADAASATMSQAALPAGGAGIPGAGGIGGGGSGIVPSSYTRPASSFATPNTPKLPTGFGASGAPEPVASASPSGMGGGGLYGAPGAMAREGGAATSEKTSGRTMQLTARPAVDGGERRRN